MNATARKFAETTLELIRKVIVSVWCSVCTKLMRIARLLVVGYSSDAAQRKYERTENWSRFHATLLRKIENILIVSGLLLSSNANLLCTGPTRRMTYTTVMAGMFSSFLSITFGMLCLWTITGVHPTRLKYLVRGNHLFYYLHATPSLFGGLSALAFFVAVGAWSWLEGDHGWATRIVSVVIGAALVINAVLCFILGASNWADTDSEGNAGPVLPEHTPTTA